MAPARDGGALAAVGWLDRAETADRWSDPDPEGDAPKAEVVVAEGDVECDGWRGRPLGDVTAASGGGSTARPGSIFGVTLDVDLRPCCLLSMLRDIGGGCTKFWGT